MANVASKNLSKYDLFEAKVGDVEVNVPNLLLMVQKSGMVLKPCK